MPPIQGTVYIDNVSILVNLNTPWSSAISGDVDFSINDNDQILYKNKIIYLNGVAVLSTDNTIEESRYSTLQTLAGTKWVLNSNLGTTTPAGTEYNYGVGHSFNESYELTFASNSNNYTQFRFHGLGEGGDTILMYDSTYINSYLSYDGGDGYWNDEAYRTIEITGGTDATNADLISWLQANAELQEDPEPEDNKFSFGSLPITGVYFGNQKVTKISLGNIDIYNDDSPTPPVTYDHSITYNTENFHGFTITGPAGYNDGDEEIELLLTCDAHRYPTQESLVKTWPDGFAIGATLTAYVTGDGPIKLTELSGNDITIGAVPKYFGQIITLHVSVTGGEGKDNRSSASSDYSSTFSMDIQVPHGNNIDITSSVIGSGGGGVRIKGDASHLSTSTVILSDNLRYEQNLALYDETASYRVYSTSPAVDWWPDDIYMTVTCDQAHDLAGRTFIIDNVAEAVDRWFYCNKDITTNVSGETHPQVDEFVSLSPSGITSNGIHMKGVVDGFISPLGAKGVNGGAEGYYLSDNDEIIKAVSYGTYNSGTSPTVEWAAEAYRTIKFDNVYYVNPVIEQFLLNYGDEVL